MRGLIYTLLYLLVVFTVHMYQYVRLLVSIPMST